VAGVIHCADPDNTGVDMYIGTGGAPEGVLAAAALRCIGGQMQCRLILDTEEKRERAHKMGVKDPRFIYGIEDMARGDCLFAATSVTTGSLLSGVKFRKGVIETETVVMRSGAAPSPSNKSLTSFRGIQCFARSTIGRYKGPLVRPLKPGLQLWRSLKVRVF